MAITGEIEGQLKQLVAQFGEKNVIKALDPLVTKCKWKDWQCVANAIHRLARESERRKLENQSAAVPRLIGWR